MPLAAANQRRTDSLDYLQSMLRELREIAEAERYNMLAHLIEMAYLEASDIIRGERPMRVRPTGPAVPSNQKRDSAA